MLREPPNIVHFERPRGAHGRKTAIVDRKQVAMQTKQGSEKCEPIVAKSVTTQQLLERYGNLGKGFFPPV